eukprot:10724627-Alexandrium_andersonii.AAC.1
MCIRDRKVVCLSKTIVASAANKIKPTHGATIMFPVKSRQLVPFKGSKLIFCFGQPMIWKISAAARNRRRGAVMNRSCEVVGVRTTPLAVTEYRAHDWLRSTVSNGRSFFDL